MCVCVSEGGSGSSTMGFGFGSYWGALWAHSIDNCLTRGSIVEVDGAGGRYRKRASATVDVFATSCKLSSELFSTVLYNEHVIKPKS